MKNAIPPKSLYKYRAPITPKDFERLENMITNGECFFSSPWSFNDIFDCKPTLSYACKDNEYINGYIAIARKRGDCRVRAELVKEAMGHIGTDRDPRSVAFSNASQDKLHNLLDTWGVYCLAESPTNLLMWSHYAASYTGICLELDTKDFAFLSRVEYQEERPVIRWLDGLSPWESAQKALFTKSKHWEYEAEWRALANANHVAKFGPSLVKGIIFGPKCQDETIEKVESIVEQHKLHIRFSKIVADRKNFVLEIVDL